MDIFLGIYPDMCTMCNFVEKSDRLSGQVEAENRWIEAAVVTAVEQKHESESKVLELQQEVRWSQPNPLFFCTPGLHAITSSSSSKGPATPRLPKT